MLHHQAVGSCNNIASSHHTSYSLYPTTIHQSQSSSSTSSLYNPQVLPSIQQIAAAAPHLLSTKTAANSEANNFQVLVATAHHSPVAAAATNNTNNISGIHFNQANNIININTNSSGSNTSELTSTSVNCYCPALIQQLPTGGVAVCYQPTAADFATTNAEFLYHHHQSPATTVLLQQQHQAAAATNQIISNQITTNNFLNNLHTTSTTYLNGKEIMVRIPTSPNSTTSTANFCTVPTTTTFTTCTTTPTICVNNTVGYFLPFDDHTLSLDSTDVVIHKNIDQIHFNIEYDYYCNQAEADSTTRSRPFSNNKKVF